MTALVFTTAATLKHEFVIEGLGKRVTGCRYVLEIMYGGGMEITPRSVRSVDVKEEHT